MWVWGVRSQAVLTECHPALRDIASMALARSPWDLMAREGRRDRETQNLYYRMGLSQLRYPHSKHNAPTGHLAHAIHLIPLPLRWDLTDRFVQVSGIVLSCAYELGVELTWGGEWSFRDLAHYELAETPPWRTIHV